MSNCLLLHQLQPFPTVTMSLTASLLSGYNTIGERRIKEKCEEQRIEIISSIGRYTVEKFTSYTFLSKAKSCRTFSLLPVLLPSHKQRNAPLYRGKILCRATDSNSIGLDIRGSLDRVCCLDHWTKLPTGRAAKIQRARTAKCQRQKATLS